MQRRISNRSVSALTCPPNKSREILWDDSVSGFGCVVHPTGRKVYVVQYRRGGRSFRVSLGEHGRLTPDQARSEARKMLGLVETGHDPLALRREAREARTFKDIAHDFLETHVAKKRKASTYREYSRILNFNVLPVIGRKGIKDVTKADVHRIHASMSASPYEANRTIKILSAIWTWAARRDEVTGTNPCSRLEKFPEQPRERYLTDEELARLGDALRTARIDHYAAAAIKLLILTGARLREILDAKWEYVDVERGVIFLPDSKTGKKTIYLGAAALEVITGLPRLEGNSHIIPGQKDGQPKADLHGPWKVVTKAAKLEGVRVHDLRHSFASIGAGAQMGLPILGKLLGHSKAATTERYAHVASDPMRRAAETIGATISAAMNGGKAE